VIRIALLVVALAIAGAAAGCSSRHDDGASKDYLILKRMPDQ